jgi:hypothetical protein
LQKLGRRKPFFSSFSISGQLFGQYKQLSANCKSSTFISIFIIGWQGWTEVYFPAFANTRSLEEQIFQIIRTTGNLGIVR